LRAWRNGRRARFRTLWPQGRGGSTPSVRTHALYYSMAKSALDRQQDGTIKLTITIPHGTVAKLREETIAELVKSVNVAGFRKGKAPQKMVEEKIDKSLVQENILKKALPSAYMEAVQEHSLRPIMNPKIHIEKLEEGEDWMFTALTCEMPIVDLGDYKKNVQKVTAKGKIVIPGKEQQKPPFEEIAKAILDSVKVQIPQILIEQETDRLLSQLLDDIKRLGLNLEQYLASTKRSADDLRKEYSTRAENDLKFEFVLQKIAEAEKITVEEKEIEEAIQKAKDPAEKQHLSSNKYLLASVLRQQKTLDFLTNL
jgi:FKBP-type peptidyl-prolyl cis-trans isomerase (trigger factor)